MRRGKSATPSARRAPRGERAARLAACERELAEARAERAATAEILKTISRSASDPRPAFETILDASQRLFGTDQVAIFTIGDDAMVRMAAGRGPLVEAGLNDVTPLEKSLTGLVTRERRIHHIPDQSALPDLSDTMRERLRRVGAMSLLYAPMLAEDRALGSFGVLRAPPHPFSEREQALAQSLADQAAIAIENARLFGEAKAKTRDLEESLAQQTATADVLKVVSRSAFDVQAVLDTLVTSAYTLCGGVVGLIYLSGKDAFECRAVAGARAEEARRLFMGRPIRAGRGTAAERTILSGEVECVEDYFTDPEADPEVRKFILAAAMNRSGPPAARSLLAVPMKRDNEVVGVIAVGRAEPGRLPERQIDLLRTFADQAVIAIENARMFDEVQAKTRDLQESLRQQTATADVLKVIGRSAFDLETVLNALIASARMLCEADFGAICLRDGDLFHAYASSGGDPAFLAALKGRPQRIDEKSLTPRVARSGRIEHIPDRWLDPDYQAPLGTQDVSQPRTLLGVPLLREGRVEGTFVLMRVAKNPFSPRYIELAQTFADQAMIAIGNVRLFDAVQGKTRDLEEALARQTATANVLKVISRSVSDAAPVFETIVESCRRLSGLEAVAIYLVEGDMVRGVAQRGWTAGDWGSDAMPLAGSSTGLAIAERKAVHFPDLADKPDLPEEKKRVVREMGGLSVLYAPMLLEAEGVGSIVVSRKPKKPFSDNEIALLQSFADQAAIAIQNARLFNETKESLAQQTATADVLKVISRSAFDLDAVFDALLATAVRLIGCAHGTLCLRQNDEFRYIASFGLPPEFRQWLTDYRVQPGRSSAAGRVMMTGQTVVVRDVLDDPEYLAPAHRLGHFRSMVAAPLLRENAVEGVLVIARGEPGDFSARQIELVETFADQAVIAVENTRLFSETREALERERASANVLKAISNSVSDARPVFEEILRSIEHLFGADERMIVMLGDDDKLHIVAVHGPNSERTSRQFPIPLKGSASEIAFRERRLVSYDDVFNDPDVPPGLREYAQRFGVNYAFAGAPMIWKDRAIGAILVGRTSMQRFNEKERAQLSAFTDQAVIAIQNARLFEEVRAKTRDLEEALAQQTATADVLKVISRSAFDLRASLDALVRSAARLCEAQDAAVWQVEGNELVAMAHCGVIPLPDGPRGPRFPISRDFAGGHCVLDLRTIHVIDAQAEPNPYPLSRALNVQLGVRTALSVPLVAGGTALGAIFIRRSEVRPFTERQIALLQTFADQAVIAIENSRLFEEVQAKTRDLEEALAQQTATADVLKVISRSVFDLNPVLQTLIDTAVRLARGSRGTIWIRQGDALVASAFHHNVPAELRAYLSNSPRNLSEDDPMTRAARDKAVVHIPDFAAYQDPFTEGVKQRAAFGAGLWVPLIRDGETIGVFGVPRDEPIAFTDREIEIVRTFADQAVIAIENARLFEQVQAKTRDLEEALAQQTATAEVLKVISRSAFDLQAVLDTLIESAVKLCGGENGVLYLEGQGAFHVKAAANEAGETKLLATLRSAPQYPGRGSVGARVLLTGEIQNVADVKADPEYQAALKQSSSNRGLLGVPLKRGERVIGAMVVARNDPGVYDSRQVEIAQTFADQAVIAIENTRLFDEVQARTRELAASLEDLRKAQDRLVQSEKLASLGQLTAGIAHEIKNPLNFVNNFSSLSRELLGELKETLAGAPLETDTRADVDEILTMVDSNLEKVVSHGQRADSIVKNMLLHSREGSGERTRVNINAMVEEALNLGYHGARAEKTGFNVTIEKALDPAAGFGDLYLQEMTRVLLNLISNGFYATTKRKLAEAHSYEPTLTASTRNLGERVEIRIRDNGTGIPEEVKAKMFNPFFTTKPAGEGTGLGLSLSHDIIVKQHGGAIEVATEAGQFSEFIITLPRSFSSAPEQQGAMP